MSPCKEKVRSDILTLPPLKLTCDLTMPWCP